jgi:membrane associated rhomboid family serine protease
MFPLGDENPSYTRPFVTYTLILINVAVFLWEIIGPFPLEYVFEVYGFIPARLDAMIREKAIDPYVAFTLLSSMFLHADPLHILGNMIYLWVFGDNVEDTCGHTGFIIFYLLSGLGGGLLHYYSDPASVIPSLGASGAISGVLAGYVLLFPYARIRVAIVGYWGFWRVVRVQALWMIGLWFLMQVFFAFIAGTSGVAYWAHIGGFVAGLALIKLFARSGRPRRRLYVTPYPVR